MYQLRTYILSVTVCLRSIATDITLDFNPDDGWPPQDQPVCAFFRENNNKTWMGEEVAGAFLGALFRVMNEILKKSKSLEAFNTEWSIQDPKEPLQSLRHESFVLVRNAARALLVDNEQALMTAREIIPHDKQIGHTAFEWHTRIHKILMEDAVYSLLATYRDMDFGRFIAVAFDECIELNRFGHNPRNPYPQSQMTVTALQRMMKTCENHAIWFFLLDIHSPKPGLYAPKPDRPSSARLCQEPSLLPPWPYFGFDLMVDATELTKPKPANIGLSLEHWKLYGRPYWFSLPSVTLLDSATQKLFSAEYMCAWSDTHVFAAFSQRVLVDLASTDVARYLADTAVSKHMRLFTGVVDGIVRSGAPSEPMLAVAAAEALLRSEGTYREAISTFVSKVILRKPQVLNMGTLGELLARIILTMARDGALGTSKFPTGTTINPVSVLRFIKMLVKYDMPREFTDFAKQYVINFSHFYQLSNDTTMLKSDFLRKCWYRGVALQGSTNQPVWDILIPAYEADELDAPFDVKNMCLLVIQINCRTSPSSVEHLTAPFVDYRDDKHPSSKPPHIAILMDLPEIHSFSGTRTHIDVDFSPAVPPVGSSNDPSLPSSISAVSTSKPLSNFAIRRTFFCETLPETKRWFIRLRGHEGDVYPVISELGPALLQNDVWRALQKPLGAAATKFMRAIDPLSRLADTYSY
ncbi:hypothetical protein HGRIS_005010 [Hohenbuehelia grisea]